jgi:hypothetical protein
LVVGSSLSTDIYTNRDRNRNVNRHEDFEGLRSSCDGLIFNGTNIENKTFLNIFLVPLTRLLLEHVEDGMNWYISINRVAAGHFLSHCMLVTGI